MSAHIRKCILYFLTSLIVVFGSVASTGSGITDQSLSAQLKSFSYEGNRKRQVAKEFIEEVRGRVVEANPKIYPLSQKRVKELILYTEIAVKHVNEKMKESRWYTGHPVSEQEIFEGIATANMFLNIIAQQKWEKLPNIGYMDIRSLTALNALWDMKITMVGGWDVPKTVKEYEEDIWFRNWFENSLQISPFLNILTGTWTFCKMKNLANGSFQKTIAFYTMGRKSYYRKLKEKPESQGLAKVAWGHWKRWKKWHLVWKQVEREVPKVQ